MLSYRLFTATLIPPTSTMDPIKGSFEGMLVEESEDCERLGVPK